MTYQREVEEEGGGGGRVGGVRAKPTSIKTGWGKVRGRLRGEDKTETLIMKREKGRGK